MNRRDFFVRVGGAALAFPVLVKLAGCGKEGTEPPPPDAPEPAVCARGTEVVIADNHGHQLTVSAADVQAGVAKTYDIQGSSPHTHTVTLTAALFQMLANGEEISVVSSTNSAHDHVITVVCI